MVARDAVARRAGGRSVRVRSVVVGAAGSLLLSALALAPGIPHPAAAAGLPETVTTYTVDPDRSQVDVALDIVPTAARQLFDGPGVNGQYTVPAERIDVWVADQALAVAATMGGGTIGWSPVPRAAADPSGYHRIEVAIPAYHARTIRHVAVAYTLPDAGIRADATTRVLPDYVHLCAHASGALGGRVIVEAPIRFTLDTSLGAESPFNASSDGGTLVLQSGSIGLPDLWSQCLDLVDPARDHVTSVMTGGGTVTLRSWPGDTAWQTRVTAAVQNAVPQLVALIGRPLPKVAGLTIREAFVAPGYEGLYGRDANQILLSEFMTSDTLADGTVLVAHELAHAWFNHATQGPVWLMEGSAEWAARSVVPSASPCLTAPAGADGKTLATWKYLSAGYTKAQEQDIWDEYDTACTVVTLVARAAGPDGTRAALAALFDRRDPYGATRTRSSTDVVSWQDWLDAMDELGVVPNHGSDALASGLLLKYGAASDGALLGARIAARRAYHDLISRAAPWAVPVAIRDRLSAWDFPEAQLAIATASTAWEDVAQSDRLVPGANALAGPIRVQWESAQTQADLDAVLELAKAQLAAAVDVAAAMAPLQSPLGLVPWVGSLGSSTPTLADAKAAVGADNPLAAEQAAAALRAELVRYEREGSRRLALGSIVAFTTLVLLGLVIASRVAWRPRRRVVALASVPATSPVAVTVFDVRAPMGTSSRDQHLPPPPPGWYAAMVGGATVGPPPPPSLDGARPLLPLIAGDRVLLGRPGPALPIGTSGTEPPPADLAPADPASGGGSSAD